MLPLRAWLRDVRKLVTLQGAEQWDLWRGIDRSLSVQKMTTRRSAIDASRKWVWSGPFCTID
jgi:hypothetical protein